MSLVIFNQNISYENKTLIKRDLRCQLFKIVFF